MNFGEVWEQIERFTNSCNCTAIEPKSLTIPAGERRSVTLTLDLTPRSNDSASTRPFEMQIAAHLRDGQHESAPEPWTIRGTVRSAIWVEPGPLRFGKPSHLQQPLAAQERKITALVPLQTVRADPESSNWRAQVTRPDPNSNFFTLSIFPDGPLPCGRFQFPVTLTPILPDGTALPSKNVPVEGEIRNDIQTTPAEVVLGVKDIGETVEEVLTLYSLTDRPFEVESIVVPSESNTEVRRGAKEAGGQSFIVRQRVTQVSGQTIFVRFAVRIGGEERVKVTVPVRYHGTAK